MQAVDERAENTLEYSVIGAMCIEPDMVKQIAPLLKAEDFYVDACREVYTFATTALMNHSLFDAAIAADALAGSMGAKDARLFIKECMVYAPTAANAESCAKLLHERAALRRLRGELLDTIGNGAEKGSELAASVMNVCQTFLEGEKEGRTKSMNDALMSMYQELGKASSLIRVDTGFPMLDAKLKGVWGGNLCLIGARPGVGKSAMALSIAENTAKKGGTVLIYSMEMLAEEVAERAVARHGPTLDKLIENVNLTQEDYQDIARACGSLSQLPIYINDAPNMTVSKIRREAVGVKNLHLIIVDFLSLMKADGRYDKRYLELGAISRDLKLLAAELRVPVIALAQLNRDKNDTERPTLANLRDSGELEQNANKVLFMWNEDETLHQVGVSVAKNRRGRKGAVKLRFDGEHMRFYEIDEIHEEPGGGKRKWQSSNEETPW